MGERLRSVREPVAWIVLVISGAYIALSLVEVGLMIGRDGQSWSAVGSAIGGSSLSPTLVIAVVAAVLACLLVKPPVRHAREIALVGALLLSVSAVLELVFTALGTSTAVNDVAVAMEVVGGLLGALFKAVLAVVVWRAWTQAPRPGTDSPATRELPATDPVVPEQNRPTWHPDRAVGSSWSRAGDAATGASASTVGQPGEQSSGWQVPGQQPRPTQPPVSTQPPPATPAGTGGWVPPSQQVRPAPAPPTPWATAFETAQGAPAVVDGSAESEPPIATDGRSAPVWRPVDPTREEPRS